MRKTKYAVALTEAEPARLRTLIGRGKGRHGCCPAPASCSRPTRGNAARAGVMRRLPRPWRCIPPEANADSVWHMEVMLHVYQRPYDPGRPLVCPDETCQALAETRAPLPATTGRPARHDPEYARDGVLNVFLVSEPLRGRRQVRFARARIAPTRSS